VAQFHRSTLHALQELVQAAGLRHPKDITAHHIVRRISDTEVRLLSNLITRMQPGALLGPLDAQHNVFRLYWPLASAHSFQASEPALEPSIPHHVELVHAAAVGTAAAVAGDAAV
jgi:hypothetical protein